MLAPSCHGRWALNVIAGMTGLGAGKKLGLLMRWLAGGARKRPGRGKHSAAVG